MRETSKQTKALVFVHELRAAPSTDDELDWFFNRVESDMGVSSNFRACLGLHAETVSLEGAVEASHRHRTIRRALKAIPDRDAGVLQAAYELRDWPIALYDALGRLTGIVVRLACAEGAWPADRRAQQRVERERARALASSGSVARCEAPFVQLRREAEVLFARAHKAFRAARGARS